MESEAFRETHIYMHCAQEDRTVRTRGDGGEIAEKMRGCLVFRQERIIDGGGRYCRDTKRAQEGERGRE